MADEDSAAWKQLKADIARRVPDAIYAANRRQAERFIEESVRAALKMMNIEDPLVAEKALIDATVWVKQAHREIDKALTEKIGVDKTMARFNQ